MGHSAELHVGCVRETYNCVAQRRRFPGMRHVSFTECVFVLTVLCASFASGAYPTIDWVKQNIRASHPRLYITPERLAAKRAGRTPAEQAYLDSVCATADGSSGEAVSRAEAQAVYFALTGVTSYRDAAITYLQNTDPSISPIWGYYYHRSMRYISAFDLLYNDMTLQQRQAIAARLVTLGDKCIAQGTRDVNGDWYQMQVPLFFIGLTLFNTGLNDAKAVQYLEKGYEDFCYVFTRRQNAAADDGGFGDHTVDYNIGNNGPTLQAMMDFCYAFRAATGADFTQHIPGVVLYNNFILWNTIVAPAAERSFGDAKQFGLGYTWHGVNSDGQDQNNEFRMPAGAIAAFADLYPSTDNVAASAFLLSYRNWTSDIANPFQVHYGRIMPFAFNIWPTGNPDRTFLAAYPRARHFDGGGVVFMNSGGWSDTGTYAAFVGGTRSNTYININHKHNDESHFVIYKRGHLAIDRGTRFDQFLSTGHANNFYNNSIAHNVITVYMPGEQITGLVSGVNPEANDGGMNRRFGSTIHAFETNDQFTYIACDVTPCYNSAKVSEVTRQFVFIYPDYFIVFDRVQSTVANYRKAFVYHAQNDITINGRTFSADHWNGRVFVRSVLPSSATMVKIGGPGNEFFVDGRNYPITNPALGPNTLRGQWRIEVSPAAQQLRDYFLHVIQVGDRSTLNTIVASTYVEDAVRSGVRFTTLQGTTCTVTFNRTGALGGWITIVDGSQNIDRALTTTVQPQSGFTAGSGGISTQTVLTPTITPSSGTYRSSVTVAMTCATPGATIRYTLDGSDPGAGDMADAAAYLTRCRPNACLVDSRVEGVYGGTGLLAPWDLVAEARETVRPLILSGGLNPENVAEAIRVVRPFGVDTASGVESEPGRKDAQRVRRFVRAAMEAVAAQGKKKS